MVRIKTKLIYANCVGYFFIIGWTVSYRWLLKDIFLIRKIDYEIELHEIILKEICDNLEQLKTRCSKEA